MSRCQLKDDMGRGSRATKLVAALSWCSGSDGATSSIFVTTPAGGSSSGYTADGCVPTFISDGYCDFLNNKAECQYDGGDVSHGRSPRSGLVQAQKS